MGNHPNRRRKFPAAVPFSPGGNPYGFCMLLPIPAFLLHLAFCILHFAFSILVHPAGNMSNFLFVLHRKTCVRLPFYTILQFDENKHCIWEWIHV